MYIGGPLRGEFKSQEEGYSEVSPFLFSQYSMTLQIIISIHLFRVCVNWSPLCLQINLGQRD